MNELLNESEKDHVESVEDGQLHGELPSRRMHGRRMKNEWKMELNNRQWGQFFPSPQVLSNVLVIFGLTNGLFFDSVLAQEPTCDLFSGFGAWDCSRPHPVSPPLASLGLLASPGKLATQP